MQPVANSLLECSPRIDNPKMDKLTKKKGKMEIEVIEDLMTDLQEKFLRGIYSNTIGDGKGKSDWMVSRLTHCGDEWSQVIKSLRAAQDDIRQVRFSNSFVEQRLNEYCNEVKGMTKTSEVLAEKLNELSKSDVEFTRAVTDFLSRSERGETRTVKFRNAARKSKSDECSVRKMRSSCGLILKENRALSRREKSRRKKEYGKYCSICGAVEVPSQNSMIRCCDCDGEIIVQGQCSSCDSLEIDKTFKRCNGIRTENTCLTCAFAKKRIWIIDKKECDKVEFRKENLLIRKGNFAKGYESNYCSDCEFASSCQVSATNDKQKRNISADSLVPRSDSDNIITGMRSPYSCDYDVSSSVSSFDPGTGKSSLVPLVRSRVEEGDTSLDEEYATPREHLSTEDVTFVETRSDPTAVESTLIGGSDQEVSDRTDSDEYIEASEPSDTGGDVEPMITIREPVPDNVCDRMQRAQEALSEMRVGDIELEEGILSMEKISQENLKLSMIFRDLLMEMGVGLNQTEKVKAKDESESSDDFEEALDDVTEVESFYDIQPSSRCYLCPVCGIGFSHQQLTNCLTCERETAEIPKSFFEKPVTEDSSQTAGNRLVSAPCICQNSKPNGSILSAFPVILRGDLPRLPFTSVEDRLKLIERETNLLRDNNEIINLFVDDLKTKLKNELECVNSVYAKRGDATVVGFDVSLYHFTRHTTERRTKEETVVEEVKEEICQKGKTFVEMKIEQVFKKEQQTAVELEIFEQRLEIEGLIIKEKEDFGRSLTSQMGEEMNLSPMELPHGFTSEKFPTAKRCNGMDNLLVSIEIEVEKDKKAMRCEYKANVHKRKSDEERTLPTITLYPMWTSNHRSTLSYGSGASTKISEKRQSDFDFNSEEQFFIDFDRDELVEIKSPKLFSVSSDDEDEEWNKEKVRRERVTGNAFPSLTMPVAMYSVMEITLSEIPFAVLNILQTKKEFGGVSQIELGQSPESGVVFLQTEAVSSISVINCHEDGSLEEFFETKSYSDTTFDQKNSNAIPWKPTEKKSLVRFIPVNFGGSSIAFIPLADSTLPILVADEIKPVSNVKSIPELNTALSLMREIENEVDDVKLDNAIAILPQSETVLRERIQDRVKVLHERSSDTSDTSLNLFMSTMSFTAGDEEKRETELQQVESYERLRKMLNLLTGLEEAVRQINDTGDGKTDCEKPGRMYHLIRDLSTRLDEIGNDVDVSAIEKPFEFTSESDIYTVRDYTCDLLKDVKMSAPETQDVRDCITTAGTLKSIRKNIFEIVAFEAQERDKRIEENMARIARLEKENFQVMRFLDTLLDKTLRRVKELDEVKESAALFRNEIKELMEKTPEEETPSTKMYVMKIGQTPTLPRIQEVSSDYITSSSEEENIRETLSDMMVALENLKTKAKEKVDRYREIFGDNGHRTCCPIKYGHGLDLKSSTCTQMVGSGKEGEKSRITQFSRIGANTFFMTWSTPMKVDEKSQIVGYEIWVNGKVNQRVRNPERLKAVLYSVHPTTDDGKLRIKLFALTEDGRRSSLADMRYPEDGS